MVALTRVLWMPLPVVVDEWGYVGNGLITVIPGVLGAMVAYWAYQLMCGQQTRSDALLNMLILVIFIAGYVALLFAAPS